MSNPETKPKTPFDHLHATLTAYWSEMASFEQAAYDRARSATADLAKLANESMTYAGQLAAEWRKLGLEATKKITEQFAAARS
jgi:hypothetical protein